MLTINEKKLNAINELIKGFASLVSLAVDDSKQTETIQAKGYTVTTQKIKCNGAINKGYMYHISISDGNNTASFHNKGEARIGLGNLASCENEYGSRFWFAKEDGKLHQLAKFGKRTDAKEQKKNLMEFVKSCLNVPISFSDRTLTYAI